MKTFAINWMQNIYTKQIFLFKNRIVDQMQLIPLTKKIIKISMKGPKTLLGILKASRFKLKHAIMNHENISKFRLNWLQRSNYLQMQMFT